MAFVSLVPKNQDIGGDDQVVQGSDWIRVFVVKDSLGAPINLSEYVGSGSPRAEFRDKAIADGGATANCPQPAASFLNGGTAGEIQLLVTHALSTAATKFSGVYSIEIVFQTAGPTNGYVNEVFYGSWAMKKENTAG